MDRQKLDIELLSKDEGHRIPADFDYDSLAGLSNELRHKLNLIRPSSIGQAGRIDGITPVGLTLILAHLKKREKMRPSAA